MTFDVSMQIEKMKLKYKDLIAQKNQQLQIARQMRDFLEEDKAKVEELLKIDPFATQRAQIEKLDMDSKQLKSKIAL